MQRFSIGVGGLVLTLLTACGGSGGGSSGSLPSLPGSSPGQSPSVIAKETTVDPAPAAGGASSVTITEYDVPKYPSQGGIAVTKDGAVWWQTQLGSAQNPGADYMVRMLGSSIEAIPKLPGGLLAESSMTSTPNGRAWGGFYDCYCYGNAGGAGLVYATAGATQVGPTCVDCNIGFDLPSFSTLGFLTTGPDGNVWFVTAATNMLYQPNCGNFPWCFDNGVSEFGYYSENAVRPNVQNGQVFDLHTPFGPSAITTGPDGNMWIAMPLTLYPQLGFYRSTLGGQMVSQMPLAGVMSIADAVTGPDHAVWFTDPVDNVIGRVTVGGSLATYPLPSAKAGPYAITVGGDGAIWFTEQNTSKIGRITTSGQISEYATPTGSASPGQIIGPASSGCGNAQLWFSEASTGKVAEVIVKT